LRHLNIRFCGMPYAYAFCPPHKVFTVVDVQVS
jgi:hypothetical protein